MRGCATVISCGAGAAVIGNAVNTSSDTTGIPLMDITSNLLDQNTVIGAGTP